MSEIPESVANKLVDPLYARPQADVVRDVLTNLSVRHELLREFLGRYRGPFWSKRTGYEFLDLIEGDETVETVTKICRSQYGFSERYLALSELSAGQIVVLDTLSDKVYEVDFEGGEKLLLSGKLEPRWENFKSFLTEYFSE